MRKKSKDRSPAINTANALMASVEPQKKYVISNFSGGVSSAIATAIALKKYPDMLIIYIHINDQHPDTMRFVKDCEKWFGKEIIILQNKKYKTVEEACRAMVYLNGVRGAACTKLLKRRVRKEWEDAHPGEYHYIWGYDIEEKKRAERLQISMPKYGHESPLIDNEIDKEQAHGILQEAGIKRPEMYDIGFPNNNCVGCVKGSKGYWNLIRKVFPDIFKSRAELERVIGASCMSTGFLDELKEGEGRNEVIVPECGFMCEIPDGAQNLGTRSFYI